jgi:protein O-GlcNAc transferase
MLQITAPRYLSEFKLKVNYYCEVKMSAEQEWEAKLDEMFAYYEAAQLDKAEAVCKQFLQKWPDYPDALYYLGLTQLERGAYITAYNSLQKAVVLSPDVAEVHFGLGNALYAQAKCEEAVASYKRSILLDPEFSAAYTNLGRTLLSLGQDKEAAKNFEQATALEPDLGEAHAGLAQALLAQGELLASIASSEKAMQFVPNSPDLLYCYANALLGLGRLEEAAKYLRLVLQLQPTWPQALSSLGVALKQLGKLAEAEQCQRQAIALQPSFVEAYSNLGSVLLAYEQWSEAETYCQKALVLRPDYADAYANLGIALRGQGRLTEATASLQRAITLRPDSIFARLNLGFVLRDCRRLQDAAVSFQEAITLQPKMISAHSNLLMVLQYMGELTMERWQNTLKVFSNSLIDYPRFSHEKKLLHQRLRIGYVSADFRMHSCSWFFGALLANHNRTAFEIFCYCNVLNPDSVTEQLQREAEHWHNIAGLSVDSTAQLIYDHQIDILVDMSGHTSGNSLEVFARKPAPVQVSWLGFPGSTGLAEIDYRLSDSWLTPEGTQEYFSEKIWNLQRPVHCYAPISNAPPVVPLPANRNGYLTFGSFNNITKLTDETITLWASVLRAIPSSRLVLKDLSTADAGVQKSILDTFATHGILSERITFLEQQAWIVDHLATYGKVDIALDTYPYNGATTTMEALWMGVPVISLVGNRTSSRYGLSFLNGAGLQDLAVDSPDAYVKAALKLSNNLEELSTQRMQLRQRIARSLLCNGPDFARSVENAFSQMWKFQ